jgi:hypothetical protein
VLDRGGILVIGITLMTIAAPALAVEGALGRTLPGVWIQPQGAVVGPAPGLTISTLPIGYMGAIGGGRLVPIGGSLFTNVDADVNTNWIVTQYVYKTETPKVNLSSSFLGVINWSALRDLLSSMASRAARADRTLA